MKILGVVLSLFILVPAHLGHSSIRVTPKEREPETLVHGPISIGLYGAPVVMFTEVNDQFGVMFGGRGGLVFNHCFVIGGAGYGLTTNLDVRYPPSPYYRYVHMGYGGLFLEYTLAPHRLVHLSAHTMIGGGTVCYEEDYYGWYDDAFFVLEPGVDLELNVSRCFRIGFGGTYRFIKGVNLFDLDDQDVSGPSAEIVFKFGRF